MFSPFVQKLKSVFQQGLEENNKIVVQNESVESNEDILRKLTDFKDSVYDCVKTIQDPEKPATLEDLNVVYENGVSVKWNSLNSNYIVRIEFNPTVPHCSLATLIGLCMKVKLQRTFQENFKLTVQLKEGSHETEQEINKQINDKERVAAAMENPALSDMVEKCIKDYDS